MISRGKPGGVGRGDANRPACASVGVTRRRNKASQEGRRQHDRRLPGKNRSMLARPGEEIRLRRADGANMAGDRPGKTGRCWRDLAEK